MLKKSLSIAFVILLFVVCAAFLVPHDKTYKIIDVKSASNIVLENNNFIFEDLTSFDPYFSDHNKELASRLKISEIEAFILGSLGKYQTERQLKGREVYIKNKDDLVYFRYGYRDKFYYSAYCIKDFEPCSKDLFETKLNEIRKTKYKVLDLNTDIEYDLSDSRVRDLTNYMLVRKYRLRNKIVKPKPKVKNHTLSAKKLNKGNIKVFFSDLTTKLKPDRNCSSDICKEILYNINNSEHTIDIAIYGYSRVPAIEEALKHALKRGVKIRLVYDLDQKGNNIYEDTNCIVDLITENNNDGKSPESKNIMHNKFYIFDDKILITGSANLSNTDMSGFNSNSIIVIESPEVSTIYKQEFEQMYKGFFHNQKIKSERDVIQFGTTKLQIYFSPQDKAIENSVLPIIKNAKKFIYIPTFVLTEKRVAEELINAKKRGVDVKIIIDALNASSKYSKHQLLRDNGCLVKTENFAGKMHSKSMIVDDEYVIIGSMNFSYSGENKNDENFIVINDSEIAQFYRKFFLYQWEKIDNKWLKFNARAEGKDSIGSCEDGIDNNYDGLIDMDDPACRNEN